MNKITLGILGTVAMSLSTAVLAGGPDVTPTPAPASGGAAASGFYINGNVGYGKTDVSGATDNTGIAWSAALGYQFNPYLALEGGYIDMARIKGTDLFGNTVKIHPSAIYLAAKGIYPVSSNFDVFAKAGAARTSVSATVTGISVSSSDHYIVPLAGLGADYYFNPNLAVTVQGLYTFKKSGDFPETYMGTVGLTYKFAGLA